jgi:hypothetical protein
MDKDLHDKLKAELGPDLEYWVRPAGRRRWDEWGSPVGLGLAWALFIVSLGVFLVLIHFAGLLH